MYSVEKTKGINFFRQFDYLLFTTVLLLSVIGIVVLHSATRVLPNGINGNWIMKMQIASLVIGIVLAVVISMFDYKDFKSLGFVFYCASILLLLLVYLNGVEQYGSKSWLKLPGIGSFQPSEFAKIAFIIFISIYLEQIKDNFKDRKINILKLLVYSAIPIGFVLIQPDIGTAMVFMFIFAVMVFFCELPYKYILTIIGAFLVSTPFLWFFVLGEVQKNRFRAFFTPEKYAQNSAFNVIRSMTAIGSGQMSGKGLYHGIQTQNMGVPVKESDFIFAVIGEELGFIGAAAVLVLALIILLRCLYIARNSRDTYGTFLLVGIFSMFTFHFVENIGMNIGLLPVTGIPLPFVSSGRSAMVTNYIALGIALSVSMRKKKIIFNK